MDERPLKHGLQGRIELGQMVRTFEASQNEVLEQNLLVGLNVYESGTSLSYCCVW